MKSMKNLCFLFVFVIHHSSFCLFADPPAASLPQAMRAGWPQLQRDPQRTGFTPDEAPPPYKVVWEAQFWPEALSMAAQPIVYDGKVLIPTLRGNVYALDAFKGEPVWKTETGAAIMHTLAAEDGLVFAADIMGAIHAFTATDGKSAWRFKADAPFDTAPLLAEGRLFIGSRGGIFYALDAKTGAQVWQLDTEAPVCQCASYNDGLVFFGDESMRLQAVNAADGAEVWRSGRLPGQSFQRNFPVIHKGMVFVRTCLAGLQDDLVWGWGHLDGARSFIWPFLWTPGEKIIPYLEDMAAGRLPDDFIEPQKQVVQFYDERPERRDFHVFREKTGERVGGIPSWYAIAINPPISPPCVDADGLLVVPATGPYRCRPWRLDPERKLAVDCIVDSKDCLDAAAGKIDLNFRGAWLAGGNSDEDVAYSAAGRTIFLTHPTAEGAGEPYVCAFDLDTRRITDMNYRTTRLHMGELPKHIRLVDLHPEQIREQYPGAEKRRPSNVAQPRYAAASAAAISDGWVYRSRIGRQITAWRSVKGEFDGIVPLFANDIIDWRELTTKFLDGKEPAVAHIRSLAGVANVHNVRSGTMGMKNVLSYTLLEVLNDLMKRPALYEAGAFEDVALRPQTKNMLEEPADKLTEQDVMRRNRLLLEDVFAAELERMKE